MNRTIDCRNLDCPEPVLRTKKALEELPEDSILEVLVNSPSSIANVQRYAANSGYECRLEERGGEATLTIVKGFACEIASPASSEEAQDNPLRKTLFVKDDKVGEGELGGLLMLGFFKSTLEMERLPENIIFVNRGVLLTTDEETHGELIAVLRELEKRGVKIYSCGLCMQHFGIEAEKLRVGEIGNAYDTMKMLLETSTTTL